MILSKCFFTSAYYKIVNNKNKGIRKQVSEYSKLKTKLLFGNIIVDPSLVFKKKYGYNQIVFMSSFFFKMHVSNDKIF